MKQKRTWWLVTGASSGIGAAVVQRGLAEGHSVLAVGRRARPDRALWGESESAVRYVSCDFQQPSAAKQIAEALDTAFSESSDEAHALLGLVHAAGISKGAPAAELTDDDWAASFQVNVDAVMRINRALIPRLVEAGGAIVHVASPVGIIGARKVSYAASKAALLGLNVATARNLGPAVRVNAVLPGATITGMTCNWDAQKQAQVAAQGMMGRLCTPGEVAGPIAFLLGPDASYITGEVLNVTGGANPGI